MRVVSRVVCQSSFALRASADILRCGELARLALDKACQPKLGVAERRMVDLTGIEPVTS
jgi:hypothetical protein